MNYENRIVLFLDILGFKSIINKTVNKDNDIETSIESLYNSLNEIRTFLTYRLEEYKSMIHDQNKSVRVTQFSDSIIISFVNDKNITLLNLIIVIQELIIKLVNNGLLCRGAISYGKLVHDENIIFGPALNDAYETETKAALYPRIILDKSVIDLGKSKKSREDDINSRENIILGYLSRDSDEKYYIDYFPHVLRKYTYVTNIQSYLSNLRTIIAKGSRFTTPDLKVKYGWMRNKYNSTLEILQDESKILEISKEPGLFDYITKLKKLN